MPRLPVTRIALALALATSAHADLRPAASVTDGSGGVIVVWEDSRTTDRDVFAQHLDALVTRTWSDIGRVVCGVRGHQLAPMAAADGAGGAFVAWDDERDGTRDVYAQAIDADGAPRWAAGGVPVCTLANDQLVDGVTVDGAGGVFVTWIDYRVQLHGRVYAQHLDANGSPQWTEGGVPVCPDTPGEQGYAGSVSDGAGGVIVAWTDTRAGAGDVYAQRLAADGTPQWAATGAPACVTPADDDIGVVSAADGAHGVVLAWYDFNAYVAHAQRLDASGAAAWGANGVHVSAAAGSQVVPAITPDGTGGAFVSWNRFANNVSTTPLQHVLADGTLAWGDGVAVAPAGGPEYRPALVGDAAGGVIVAFEDARYAIGSSEFDAYVQRVAADGARAWSDAAVGLGTGLGDQFQNVLVEDGAGGAVDVWKDYHYRYAQGPDSSLFAQRVDHDGHALWTDGGVRVYYRQRDLAGVPAAAAHVLALAIAPNPVAGAARARFTLPAAGDVTLELLDVAGRVAARLAGGTFSAGPHAAPLDGARLAPGVYTLRLATRGGATSRRVCVVR